MPFFILYGISDILFFVFFHVVKYRRKVVYNNLSNSFPNLTEKERDLIAKRFYHNLSDLFVEVIKGKTISKSALLKRVEYKNAELLDKYFHENRSVLAITGHIGNWEWVGVTMPFMVKHKFFAVVKPLSDPFWEKYITRLRLRFGKEGLIPFKQTFRVLLKNRNEKTFTLLAGDQTPTKSEIEYNTFFLNQSTPVFLGPEKMAKSLDLVILFFDIQRKKRGHYVVEISLLTDKPKLTSEFEITEMHVKALEKVIQKQPDNWLWSHRRWKYAAVSE